MYCWNMPGPSCRVTILFLQLHCRVPFAGFTTFLSRTTCLKRKGAWLSSWRLPSRACHETTLHSHTRWVCALQAAALSRNTLWRVSGYRQSEQAERARNFAACRLS